MSLLPTTRQGWGAEGDALRREADVLARARHPGVPELVAVRVDGTATELEVALPDGAPLTALALTLEEVAGVVATVATTVADLHDIGVAVGAISARSVVVSPDGHAVLADFTQAVRLDGAPARWRGHSLARRDDRALGVLLGELLDRCAPGALVDPLEGRWHLGTRRPAAPGAIAQGMAERAAAGAVTSRRLAEQLATEVPGARLPRRGSRTVESPAHPADAWREAGPPEDALDRWFEERPSIASRDSGTTAGAVTRAAVGRRAPAARWLVALVLVTAGVIVAGSLGGHRRPPSAVACGGPACASYANGVLDLNGQRYAVGSNGDRVAIGRWSCGTATLALLRPSSGQVWVYRAWPSGAAPVSPSLVATAVGAADLAIEVGTTCDALVLVHGDGTRVAVPVQPAP